jgi:hypothetical protein
MEESVLKIESQPASRLSNIEYYDNDENNNNNNTGTELTADFFISTTSYKQFLIALVEYIIGENDSLDWMAQNATPLEMENGAIIAVSGQHPPLIYDAFSYGAKWIVSKLTDQVIDISAHNPDDLITVEKSFQNGSRIFYMNSNEIDSILLPLIFYKNSMSPNHLSSLNSLDESRLILFSNRRLFCNPSYQLYFETGVPFNEFSPYLLSCTTPISFQPSIENLIDIFRLKIFEALFSDLHNKKRLLLRCIKECNMKTEMIDLILKQKWEE